MQDRHAQRLDVVVDSRSRRLGFSFGAVRPIVESITKAHAPTVATDLPEGPSVRSVLAGEHLQGGERRRVGRPGHGQELQVLLPWCQQALGQQ